MCHVCCGLAARGQLSSAVTLHQSKWVFNTYAAGLQLMRLQKSTHHLLLLLCQLAPTDSVHALMPSQTHACVCCERATSARMWRLAPCIKEGTDCASGGYKQNVSAQPDCQRAAHPIKAHRCSKTEWPNTENVRLHAPGVSRLASAPRQAPVGTHAAAAKQRHQRGKQVQQAAAACMSQAAKTKPCV